MTKIHRNRLYPPAKVPLYSTQKPTLIKISLELEGGIEGSFMYPLSGLKKAHQPLISPLNDEGWVKSSPDKIKSEFRERSPVGRWCCWPVERNSGVVVRATTNVEIGACLCKHQR